MLGSSLILAATLTMTPPDLGSVLGPSDYPVWALQDNESAAAILDLLIEPNGKISRCQSGAIYGSKRLASEICDLVKGNRVGPARDPTGNNIHGVAHTLLRLWLPDTNNGREIERLQQASDVVLSVNRLPGEAKRAEVDVAVMVDEEGKVLACEPAGPKVDLHAPPRASE